MPEYFKKYLAFSYKHNVDFHTDKAFSGSGSLKINTENLVHLEVSMSKSL